MNPKKGPTFCQAVFGFSRGSVPINFNPISKLYQNVLEWYLGIIFHCFFCSNNFILFSAIQLCYIFVYSLFYSHNWDIFSYFWWALTYDKTTESSYLLVYARTGLGILTGTGIPFCTTMIGSTGTGFMSSIGLGIAGGPVGSCIAAAAAGTGISGGGRLVFTGSGIEVEGSTGGGTVVLPAVGFCVTPLVVLVTLKK